MRVGFTGTRRGLTIAQSEELERIIESWWSRSKSGLTFHHGDCHGADAELHEMARGAIEIHPANLPMQRAYCTGADLVHPVRPPLDRNHDIVDACDILLAAPGEASEVVRSGTWSTIRYARKQLRPTVIVFPDGSVQSTEGVIL